MRPFEAVAALIVLSWAARARAGCPEVGPVLNRTERDITSFFLADAHDDLMETLDALGEGPRAQPQAVARLFLAHGMVCHLEGDAACAAGWFASGRRVAPDLWPDDYGPVARERWLEARQVEASVAVGFRNVGSRWVAVDGQLLDAAHLDARAREPWMLAPGPHLVQAGRGECADYAKTVEIADDAPTYLVALPALPTGRDRPPGDLGPERAPPEERDLALIPNDPSPLLESPPRPRRKRRIRDALILGSTSALLYGVTAGTQRAYEAPAPSERSRALGITNNGLVIGSAGLAICSAGLLVRGLVTPAPR